MTSLRLDLGQPALMISANIFDVLNNIKGMGTDVRSVGGVVTPTVRFEKMQVVG